MRPAFYLFTTTFFLFSWLFAFVFTPMGITSPCDLMEYERDARFTFYLFTALAYVHAAMLLTLMYFAKLKHWRIWLFAIMACFALLHLTRWHLVTKYPPTDPDSRPTWFEERGVKPDRDDTRCF